MARFKIQTPQNASVNTPDLDEIKEDIKSLHKDILRLKDETDNIKKDFIAVFGLFASLVTFLSVEVVIFKNTNRFSLVMAVSLFFLSALILFTLTLQNIVKDRNSFSDYIRPPFVLAAAFFIASMIFFAWAAPF